MHRSSFSSIKTLITLFLCVPASLGFAQQDSAGKDWRWPNNFTHTQSEQLVEEGKLALLKNEILAAERRFSEAIQIAKVNNGLYSGEQIPALELMIESLIAQKNWEAVDTQLEYYEWLNQQSHRKNLTRYLSGLEGMRRLLLAASADVHNPRSVRYLIAAKNVNWNAVNAIETVLGENSLRLTPWLYNIVLAHYYQTSVTKRRGMTSYEYKSDDDKIISGWSLRKNESLRISYSIGKDLLERIQQIHQSSGQTSPETEGLILVYLGDWEMLFGNKSRALDFYTQANNSFESYGVAQEAVNQFFANTTVLPAETLLTDFTPSDSEERLEFVAWSPNYIATATPASQQNNLILAEPEYNALVRFSLDSLSSSLRATESAARMVVALADLQVISATPDNTFVKDLARNEISLLQFRPKFENGVPVSMENIEMDYRFSPTINPFSISQNETTQ